MMSRLLIQFVVLVILLVAFLLSLYRLLFACWMVMHPIYSDSLWLKWSVFWLAIMILCLMSVLYVSIKIVLKFSLILREKSGNCCSGCGYNLLGLEGVVCPECGRNRTP